MTVNMSHFGPLSEFKDLIIPWSCSKPIVKDSFFKAIE